LFGLQELVGGANALLWISVMSVYLLKRSFQQAHPAKR
jgi:hypothetical protein